MAGPYRIGEPCRRCGAEMAFEDRQPPRCTGQCATDLDRMRRDFRRWITNGEPIDDKATRIAGKDQS